MVKGTVIFLAFVVAPYVLWLGLLAVSRWSFVRFRPGLRWMRILRFLGWAIGILLSVVALAQDRFPVYGLACFALSGGLFFPERWVKRLFVTDGVSGK